MRIILAATALTVAFSSFAEAAPVTIYTDEAAFDAATTNRQTTSFSVSCAGACYEPQGTTYVINGITFSSSGGLNVNSAQQQGFSQATLSNAVDSDPNDVGKPDTLTITLPYAVTAFGTNFAESQGTSGITISISNGSTILASDPPTTVAYQKQFEGFVSQTPFNTITLTDAQPDGYFIFDVTTGVAAAAPEPSTWAMMILGFCGLGFLAHRRRNQFGLAT